MDSDPFDTRRCRSAVHLMVQVAHRDREDPILLFDSVEHIQVILHLLTEPLRHPDDPLVEHTLLAFGKDGILDKPVLHKLVDRIGRLEPNGYPYGSAAWLLMARGAVCSGVYTVAVFADQLSDDKVYVSCLWYFLRSMLNYGWNAVPENGRPESATEE